MIQKTEGNRAQSRLIKQKQKCEQGQSNIVKKNRNSLWMKTTPFGIFKENYPRFGSKNPTKSLSKIGKSACIF